MKHGKNPTVRQKKFIASFRLNYENWLVSQDTPEKMVLTHRNTGAVRVIIKPDKQRR